MTSIEDEMDHNVSESFCIIKTKFIVTLLTDLILYENNIFLFQCAEIAISQR